MHTPMPSPNHRPAPRLPSPIVVSVLTALATLVLGLTGPSLARAQGASEPPPLSRAPVAVKQDTSPPSFKQLFKAKNFRAAADVARSEYAASDKKRTRKAWAKRFKKAKKATIKGHMKAAMKAYKAKDYAQAVAAAANADEAALWVLPAATGGATNPAKTKKKPKTPKRPGDKLRKAISKKLMKPVKAAMKRGDFVAAYSATGPIVSLFGDDPATEAVVGSVRAAVFRASDGHTARGEYPQALQLLDLVAKTEPHRGAEVTARKSVVDCEREVKAGAYKAAMTRAEKAIRTAGDEVSRSRLTALHAKAKRLAVDVQLDLGRQALTKAQYIEVVNRAAAADRLHRRQLLASAQVGAKPTRAPGDGLRAQAHSALIGPSRAALTRKDYAVAYAGLDPLFKVFPNDAEGRTLRGAIRGQIYAESSALMRDNRFKKARKILNIVERYEPSRRSEVQRRKQGIKVARAESVDRSAADAEAKGDELTAWALARRSAALGFAPAADRQRRMQRRLRQRGRYSVRLDLYGDANRIKQHRRALEPMLAKIPGLTRRPKQRGRALNVAVNVPWPRCLNTERRRQAAMPYTTYHESPNPQWNIAKRQHQDALARWQRADADLRRADGDLRGILNKLGRCASDEGRMHGKRKRIDRDIGDVQRRLALTKKMLKDARRRLRKAEKDNKAGKKGAGSILLATTMEVGRLQKTEIKQGNKLYKLQQELKVANDGLAKATKRCKRVRSDQRTFQSRRSNAASRRAQRNGELQTAKRRLKRTPRMNRIATKRSVTLPVSTVRRTCYATADVTIQGRRGKAPTARYEHPRFTEDDTHRGHQQAGIKPDPLRLKHSDARLVADADSALQKTVRKAVRKAVNARFNRRLQRAEDAWRAGRRHEAASLWMPLWLGAPERLSQSDQRRLGDYLRQEFKLKAPLQRR